MDDVVLTGLGLVTAYGTEAGRGVPPFVRGLFDGRRPATGSSDDTATQPIDPGAVEGANPRTWLASAIGEALAGADWPDAAAPPPLLLAAQAEAPDGSANPLFAPRTVTVGARRWERPLVVSHACASALFAIHLAARVIRGGAHDAVLVAGTSICNRYSSESLRVVKAIGTAPSRPLDQHRDGILIGEGAGAVLVERASAAIARGARPLAGLAASVAEIGGRSAAASDSDIVFDAMTRVLDDAGVARLDYVHAHATGTVQGDAAEIAALARLVLDRGMPDLPVSSHKGALGHLLHASAFPGVVAAVAAVRSGVVPTTVGLRTPPSIPGVSLPAEGPAIRPERPVQHALVNAFGFGGNNATVLIRRIPHRPRPVSASRDRG